MTQVLFKDFVDFFLIIFCHTFLKIHHFFILLNQCTVNNQYSQNEIPIEELKFSEEPP